LIYSIIKIYPLLHDIHRNMCIQDDSDCAVADRLAALLHARDIKPGDFVAVFATNSPEMVVCIHALSKLGAVAALINTNLRGRPFPRDMP